MDGVAADTELSLRTGRPGHNESQTPCMWEKNIFIVEVVSLNLYPEFIQQAGSQSLKEEIFFVYSSIQSSAGSFMISSRSIFWSELFFLTSELFYSSPGTAGTA